MFGLNNNIDFIIAAVLIDMTVLITGRGKYGDISKANAAFYRIVHVDMLAGFADILLNIAKTYTSVFSPIATNIFRLAYNFTFCLMVFYAYRYLRSYIEVNGGITETLIIDRVAFGIFAFFAGFSIINVFTGWMTYADANGVHEGPLYFIIFLVPVIQVIINSTVATKYRQCYTKAQYSSVIALGIICIAFTVVEYLIDSKVLLCMLGSSLSIIIMQITLETPEYSKLVLTISELEKSRSEARAAQEEAERANRAKSDFLARMSHEIRTPMNAIMGMNEMIVKETNEPSIKANAQDAHKAAAGLLEIINNILDISKIESGKMEIVEDDYSFKSLIRDEWVLFSFKAEEKGIDLNFEIDKDLPADLHGDENRIKQVFTNLLSNALKYTDSGSITLKVTCDERGDDFVVMDVHVIDTGKGIKEEEMGHLFEEFERLDLIKNKTIQGTGLGLSIVQQLLNLMGAQLCVESEYGKGSDFYFRLMQNVTSKETFGNLRDIYRPVGNEAENLPIFDGSNKHIIVVDDTPLNLKVFKALLKPTNLTITTASSGHEGLELLMKDKYDLVFLDHFMPEIDGVDIIKKIRSDTSGVNFATPIVVLTANAIKGAYDEYVEIGFDDVVFKPATQAQLNEKLWKFLK